MGKKPESYFTCKMDSAESRLSGSDPLLVLSSSCPCSPTPPPCATADALLYLGNSASFPAGKPCLLSQAGSDHLGPLVCSVSILKPPCLAPLHGAAPSTKQKARRPGPQTWQHLGELPAGPRGLLAPP